MLPFISSLRRVSSRVDGRYINSVLHQHRARRGFVTTSELPQNDDQRHEKQQTHFGFENVDVNDKERLVGDVFHNVANNYDIMNDLMSGTLHRVWKDRFVGKLYPLAAQDEACQVIDVAGGTGDIAFRIIHENAHVNDLKVKVCDINSSMLGVGQERFNAKNLNPDLIDFVECNAEKLPFNDNEFDAYTIAFGIRNCTHIDKVLSEAYRVLKPGGRFICLEFSHLVVPVLQEIYDKYSFTVIPALGQFVANDRASYQYLVESIRKFPKQYEFEKMIRKSKFKFVEHENLTFGTVAIHSGYKL